MSELFTPPQTEETDETDYLEQLVGEGKKYKDHAALAKGNAYKDKHITNIEKEAADLREELNKRLTYEEVIEKVRSLSQSPESSNESNHGGHERSDNEDVKSFVETLLNDKFNQHKQEAVAERNVETVRTELQKLWGAGYQNRLADRAKELNLDVNFLAKLAEENPRGFLNIVTPVRTKAQDVAPPRSSVSTTNDSGIPRYSDYKKMLTSGDPKQARRFLSPEIQKEIHRLQRQYGDDFMNN